LLAQVDKLERDDFVAKMKTIPPHTSEKRELMMQRKKQTNEALYKKHQIAQAMEQMRITNKWGNLEAVLNGTGKKKKKKKKSDSLPSL